MLKVLSACHLQGRLHSFTRKFPLNGGQSRASLPRFFASVRDSEVLVFPLQQRPLFPPFCVRAFVPDPKLLEAIAEIKKRNCRYVGAFLLEDMGTSSSHTSGLETENTDELKEKEFRLCEVGTLAEINSVQENEVVLVGLRRLRIAEMVSQDPLTVKVDHLKDKPYNEDDDVIKEIYFQVLSTLRDVLKTNSSWNEHVEHIGKFNYQRLADFGAAISGANKSQCQQVLEELDVHKRLKLTLELLMKEGLGPQYRGLEEQKPCMEEATSVEDDRRKKLKEALSRARQQNCK